MIDELLNFYLGLEKAYISNAFAQGLKQEQVNLITYCEKETQIEKKVLEGVLDGNAAQASLDALKDEYPDDLIDILCLILDKSIKRVSRDYPMALFLNTMPACLT